MPGTRNMPGTRTERLNDSRYSHPLLKLDSLSP